MVLYGIILLERFLGVVGVKASRAYSLTVKHYLCHILYRPTYNSFLAKGIE